jgi:ABC-type dipeptide/oligopeptide/nickel transport system ATPase component
MDAAAALRRVFPWLSRKRRVFALVGKSGTGKSFKARQVARRFRIDLLIDDGLLIKGQKIIAGRSAKREKGILTAIKTAVFANPELIEEVRQAIIPQDGVEDCQDAGSPPDPPIHSD